VWGDWQFIPSLLGRANPSRRPYAELWIGAHPELPSAACVGERQVPLDRLLAAAPESLLGEQVLASLGPRLPFLFKVLAARQPLSIQVHPGSAQARSGFEREDRLGIPVTDPKRNYRDPYHKPELLVALTDFYALRGFRPWNEILAALTETPELAALAADLARAATAVTAPGEGGAGPSDTDQAIEALYRRVLSLPQREVNALLDPLLGRLAAEHRRRGFGPDDARYWLLQADRVFSIPGRRDRGLFSMLLLNLIHLRPGQALYLPAGELHSYLRGAGLELMASSNNVLRGGLTPKHVDVDELLSVVRFVPAPAQIVEPDIFADGRRRYRVPVREFVLERHRLRTGQRRSLQDPAIRLGLVLRGSLTLEAPGAQAPLEAARGQAFAVPAGCPIVARCRSEAELWLAGVPGRP
jgi:mannose-6-phosphate isomerase class I